MKTTAIATVILLAAASTFAAEVVKRGAPVSSSKPVALEAVLESPKAYTKDAVVVEGVHPEVVHQHGLLDGARAGSREEERARHVQG